MLYKIKKIIFRVAPPVLMDLITYVYRAYKRKKNDVKYIEASKFDCIDVNQIHYSINAIFNIPLSKIRHHGGQAYNTSQHHFMRYYKDGIGALEEYYSKHTPETIYEKHFILHAKGTQSKQPWSESSSHKESAMGECGLNAEHGHSAFGPVSNKKIRLEADRLDYCLSSIKKNGYLVRDSFTREYHGFPRGYFLVSKSGEWIFRVVGAKHRVAALAQLGWEKIPICCEPGFPKCIYESDISNWPGVRSGEYKESEAKLIFDAYFRDANMELWH